MLHALRLPVLRQRLQVPAAARTSSASPTERVELDILKGETRTPEFLAKNPNGRIPALELEDGTVLAESNAILFYLADGTPFLPARPAGAGAGAAVAVLRAVQPRAVHRRGPLHPPPAARRTARAAPSCRGWSRAATRRSASWSAGSRTTRSSSPTATRSPTSRSTPTPTSPTRAGSTSTDYPAVAAWLERVAAQPGHIPITAG